MHRSNILVIACALLLVSCQKKEQAEALYNVDSLLNGQVQALMEFNASLHKQASINEMVQDTTFQPTDTLSWHNELTIFNEIDLINKSINKENYLITDGIPDEASNLLIREYKSTKEIPLVFLKLYYLDTPDKLRKLEAEYHQQNALLASRRIMLMEFSDVYNKNILTSYRIEGTQKIVLGDTVYFTKSGTIKLE